MEAEFKTAKDREVTNWLANQVTEMAVPATGLKPMHIRWCLTKWESQGLDRASGVPGPLLGTLATASPTISVRGRNLVHQVCANLGLRPNKRDVKAAFPTVAGGLRQGSLWSQFHSCAMPCRSAVEIVHLRKKKYGLCDAPKEWFDEMTGMLTNSGRHCVRGIRSR